MGKIGFYLGVVLIHLGMGLLAYGFSQSHLIYLTYGVGGGFVINMIQGGYVFRKQNLVGGKNV